MSQLLMQWLNDEVQLSRKVVSFERDFANGFLFGELLGKFNQQLNFDEFEDKDIRSSKIRNFQLLQPTFKTLNIKFNTQTVDGVIKEKGGLALQLLYQLKMQLEKVNDPHDVLMHSKTGKYNAIVPLKRIRQPKEQFDKMEGDFFMSKLNEMNRAQKTVNLDEHLDKFNRFSIVQAEKERRLKAKEEMEERNLKEEMRKIQLNKLQRNMAFMEDWNQKGIENWKKNQQIRSKNKKSEEEFMERTAKLGEERHKSQQIQMQEEMNAEIENFEKRAGESVPMGLKNKMMSEFMRKERDKRRRKMIVDQEKQTGELARRETCVLEKLNQESKQEKEIMYEIWRAYQCKDVIGQNRLLRDDQYRNKQELNVINSKFKEEEMLRTLQQEFAEEVEQQTKRQLEINVEYKLQIRQHNYEKCKQLVEILFEISEQCYEHRQNNDSFEIQEQFLRENHKLFISGADLIPYKRFRTFDPLRQLKLQESLSSKEKVFLGSEELDDYINGKGIWSIYNNQNNDILGNLVRQVLESRYTSEEVPTIKVDMPFVPFRGTVIGFAFSGKHVISELLMKKYGVQVLSIEAIMNELLEYTSKYQSGIEHSEVWDQGQLMLGQQIQEVLLNGGNIPDEYYVRAIEQKIRRTYPIQTEDEIYNDYIQQPPITQRHRVDDLYDQEGLNWDDFHKANMVNTKPYCKGWLLYDFPHNYEQAKLLEKTLTGIQPQDEPTALEARIKRAARVVAPTPYPVVPRKKQQSGVGVCVYLEMPSNELSLKRAIGRRFDYYNNTMYNLESNTPPADNAPLIERLKPIYETDNLQQQISDKNSYFMTQIQQIREWYDNFECAATWQDADGNPVEQRLSAFQTVDASQNVEKVFYEVDKIMQQQLDITAHKIAETHRLQQEALEQLAMQEKAQEEAQELNSKCVARPVELDALPVKAPSALMLDYLYASWCNIETSYVTQMESTFKLQREQREFLNTFLMDLQRKFIDLILTPDEKFYFVRNYQEQYNQFVTENPDLVEEEVCKEELHQRIDDLYDQLVDLVDQKREDLLVERTNTMNSQFIENEIDLYLNAVRNLVQAEIDRSLNSVQLLTDYYSVSEGFDPMEPYQQATDLQTPEGDDAQGRLDKLITEAIRIFNGEEEQVEDKAKKGGKPAKKDEKKGKKGKEVEEVKREITNPDGMQAIQLEKSIFKERLEAIRQVASSTIRQMKSAADTVYGKLEDWVHYTHATELKALDAICGLFRQYIEREEKIQKEIQLNFVDVVISHEVLNFLTPIPPPLPAREPVTKQRFSVSQLYNLIEDIRSITNTHLMIETKQLALMLARQNTILKLSAAQWMKALVGIEVNGYVGVRQICTYLILLTSPVPTDEDILNYALPTPQVSKEVFVNLPAWFDEEEKVGEEENTNYFDRVVYIKELLFFVHKDEEEMVSTKQYIDVLRVPGERYVDFLLQHLNY